MTTTMLRTWRRLTVGGLVLALLSLAVPGGTVTANGVHIRHGSCTNGSTWTMELEADDGYVEVDLEIDHAPSGQAWHWSLSNHGHRFAGGHATTRSSTFTVHARTADDAGVQRIVGTATNPRTGEVCRGVATY